MGFPVLETIDELTTWLPRAPWHEKRVRQVAEHFGSMPDIARIIGMELRLTRNQHQIDFFVGAGSSDLHNHNPALRTYARQRYGPKSRGLLHFLDHLADDETALRDQIPLVWMEFDHTHPDQAPDPPLLFAQLQKAMAPPYRPYQIPEHKAALLRGERAFAFLTTCMEALEPTPVDAGIRAAMATCVAGLPEEALLLSVAPMSARGHDAYRFYAAVPTSQVDAYLAAIGWPGDRRQVKQLLETAYRGVVWVGVSLDIAHTIRPNIGLELTVGGGRRLADEPALNTFIKALPEDAVCRETMTALDAFCGRHRVRYKDWQRPVTLHRLLSHIKCSLKPDRPLEVKAYIGGYPRINLFQRA